MRALNFLALASFLCLDAWGQGSVVTAVEMREDSKQGGESKSIPGQEGKISWSISYGYEFTGVAGINATPSPSTITIKTAQIDNDHRTLGTEQLRLELWASTSFPDRRAAFSGYRLAKSDPLAAMPPFSRYTDITRVSPFVRPPDGTYWIVFVISERVPGSCTSNDGYCLVDSAVFNNAQVTWGAAPPPAANYTDLWWNPAENGWGISITQHNATAFIAWYTYDNLGNPKWYVATNCPVVGSGCSSPLYETNGPAFNGPYNTNQVAVRAVGHVDLQFSTVNAGRMTYSVNGVTGFKNIVRQSF